MKRAAELTENKEAAILDTVARIYSEQGDLKTAIDWQKKAVDTIGNGQGAADIKATLKGYLEKAEAGEKAAAEESGDTEEK